MLLLVIWGFVNTVDGADFEIIVTEEQFSDTVITIEVGDRVTWRFNGSSSQRHHVVSAGPHEGLFSSGPPTFDPFELSFVFEEPGFYRYHCTLHLPAQRGWVSVEPRGFGVADPFTFADSGAWFDPTTVGQGVMLEVLEEQHSIFGAWFTFDADSAKVGSVDQRWLTLQGEYVEDVAVLEIFSTSGGAFDDPGSPTTTLIGSAELRRVACDQMILSYMIADQELSGAMELAPIATRHCNPSHRSVR